MKLRHAMYGYLLLCFACLGYIAFHWGQTFFRDFMPSHFSVSTSSHQYYGTTNTTMINLPQIVASLDDGDQFYSLQTTIALELDQADTALVIRSRHEIIDRHLMDLFRTYSLKELRSGGPPPALREDMKRVVNALLPEASVRNAYVTNWLMIPTGY